MKKNTQKVLGRKMYAAGTNFCCILCMACKNDDMIPGNVSMSSSNNELSLKCWTWRKKKTMCRWENSGSWGYPRLMRVLLSIVRGTHGATVPNGLHTNWHQTNCSWNDERDGEEKKMCRWENFGSWGYPRLMRVLLSIVLGTQERCHGAEWSSY